MSLNIWAGTKRVFSACIRRLPIISGLPDLHLSHYGDSLKEVAYTVCLGTAPLWLAALALSFSGDSDIKGFIDFFVVIAANFLVTVEQGALIIYSASMVSPVIYMAIQEARREGGLKTFPSKGSHILFVLVVQLVATVFFFKTEGGQAVNKPFAFYASMILFPFSIFVLFIAIAYKNWVSDLDPLEAIGASMNEFRTGYSSHRGNDK